jgi:hypothetical protein
VFYVLSHSVKELFISFWCVDFEKCPSQIYYFEPCGSSRTSHFQRQVGEFRDQFSFISHSLVELVQTSWAGFDTGWTGFTQFVSSFCWKSFRLPIHPPSRQLSGLQRLFTSLSQFYILAEIWSCFGHLFFPSHPLVCFGGKPLILLRGFDLGIDWWWVALLRPLHTPSSCRFWSQFEKN